MGDTAAETPPSPAAAVLRHTALFINTLHYGASNEIKEIEVCKKCPKVEPYFVPIFDPIVVKPCLDDAK